MGKWGKGTSTLIAWKICFWYSELEFWMNAIIVTYLLFFLERLVAYGTVFQILFIHSLKHPLSVFSVRNLETYPVCNLSLLMGMLWILNSLFPHSVLNPKYLKQLSIIRELSFCMNKAQSCKRSFSALIIVVSLSLFFLFLFSPPYSDLISPIFLLVYVIWCQRDTKTIIQYKSLCTILDWFTLKEEKR